MRCAVRMLRFGSIALALALGTGCESSPRPIEFDPSSDGPATPDGLYRVRTTRVGAAYLRPGVSFAEYDGVLIDPVTVSYARRSRPDRSRVTGAQPAEFNLHPETMDQLKRIFQESFERTLGRSQAYTIVSEPGPRALRVAGHIVDLSVNVPNIRGRERTFVMNSGTMTLVLDVRDSQTGQPLARVADQRVIRPAEASIVGGVESNPVNNWGAVRQLFLTWAGILRDGLDNLHALPVPPTPSLGEERSDL